MWDKKGCCFQQNKADPKVLGHEEVATRQPGGCCRDGGEKVSRFEVEMADRMNMFAQSPGNELDFLRHTEKGVVFCLLLRVRMLQTANKLGRNLTFSGESEKIKQMSWNKKEKKKQTRQIFESKKDLSLQSDQVQNNLDVSQGGEMTWREKMAGPIPPVEPA